MMRCLGQTMELFDTCGGLVCAAMVVHHHRHQHQHQVWVQHDVLIDRHAVVDMMRQRQGGSIFYPWSVDGVMVVVDCLEWVCWMLL